MSILYLSLKVDILMTVPTRIIEESCSHDKKAFKLSQLWLKWQMQSPDMSKNAVSLFDTLIIFFLSDLYKILKLKFGPRGDDGAGIRVWVRFFGF